MTELEALAHLTHEWRSTMAIARDVWEAEGRRGDYAMVRQRVAHSLAMLEARGLAELAGPEEGLPRERGPMTRRELESALGLRGAMRGKLRDALSRERRAGRMAEEDGRVRLVGEAEE